MLTPVQVPNVTDVVYDMLRQRILSGGFVPGEQLNLRQLEIQMDVSRTPLKSAIARLQVEGLVEVHPRRGTYITQFARRDIEESFELRIALEAQALRYAFQPESATQVDEIVRLLDEMDVYFQNEDMWLDEIPDFMDLDRLLHIMIVQLSQNECMKQAYERANVQGYIAIMGAKFTFADCVCTQEEHRELSKALHSKDQEKLLQTARQHLEQACQRAVVRLGELEQGQ